MNKSRSVSINDEVVLAISGARSAVKIFLFPVAKRAGTVHRGYTQAGRSKERVRFERPTGALYVPVRQEGSRRIVPRPTYTNLFTLSHDATLCVRTRSEPPRISQRESTRVLDRLLDFEHLLSCPPRTWRNVRHDSAVHV